MVSNKTYNNVVDTLCRLGEYHHQISTVSVGDIFDINLEKMRWITKATKDKNGPLYEWAYGFVEKAIDQLKKEGSLVTTQNFFLSPWSMWNLTS